MKTGARGERILEVDGRRFSVLFTNRALAEAERSLGKSAIGILTESQKGSVAVGDLVTLLHIGIEYGRRDSDPTAKAFTSEDAWKLLDQIGLVAAVELVFTPMAQVIAYTPEATPTITDPLA
jgi:hypothetical protein